MPGAVDEVSREEKWWRGASMSLAGRDARAQVQPGPCGQRARAERGRRPSGPQGCLHPNPGSCDYVTFYSMGELRFLVSYPRSGRMTLDSRGRPGALAGVP